MNSVKTSISWRGKLALALASVVLSSVFLECLVREFFPIRGAIYQLDERYLHRHIPGSRKMYRHPRSNGGQMVLVTINDHGHRGSDFSPSGGLKVAVYGDSFVAAEYSRIEDTFVHQLQVALTRQLGRPVQSLNAGVSAYGPDQESLVIDDDLRSNPPDLLVICVYAGNDFGDLLRDRLFALDAAGGLVTNHPSIAASLRGQFAEAAGQSPFHLVRAVASAMDRVKPPSSPAPNGPGGSAAGIFDVWLQHRTNEYVEYVRNGDLQVRNLFEDEYDADVSLTPDSESARYRVRLMERVLERIRDSARHARVPLLLVIIPAPFDVVEHYDPAPDPAKFPQYRRAGLCDTLQSIATRLDIASVDLFDPFWKHGAADLYYTSGNDHWNAAGQKLAAEIASTFIKEHGILK